MIYEVEIQLGNLYICRKFSIKGHVDLDIELSVHMLLYWNTISVLVFYIYKFKFGDGGCSEDFCAQ